ncbi:MAG: isoprenylcysteine carboxylmethyltransferase family protein [Firmicutes bacterium]|nr:isoprenylcysteine carboxylmethyltransferase family protein [Bacillota bacterium]
MRKDLLIQALVKFFSGLLILALLLFPAAGTLRFWNAWLLLGILFIPMFLAGLAMLWRDPQLLQKRLNAKEQEKEQKAVIACSGLMFAAAFVAAGLNHRFQWLTLPRWLVYGAAALFLAAYLLFAEVLRENAYLSRTVEVQEGQKVVDTGLYGLIRHPMYAATLILFLSMGLVLGSPLSFAILLLYIPIIGKRMKNEEKVLEDGLPGYREYRKRVKYKVIPFIW